MWKLVKHFGLQGLIFGLMAMIFVVVLAHAASGIADWVRSEHWLVTTAKVTEIRRTTGVRSGSHYNHHYRYDVEGRAYSGVYHRDDVENVRGDMIEVIFNPLEPSESARSRADLVGFGRPIFGVISTGFIALGLFMLLSGLAYVRTAYRNVRLQEALAAGERTALQAYFHGTPEEAERALRNLGALFDRAMQTAKPDTPWYSLLQRGQLRRYARLAKLHRAAGQAHKAEHYVREALACAASAALGRPLQFAREVFEYIDGEDRRILEEQGRASRP